MRRLVAIAVSMLLGFTLVAPTFGLSSSALVPACCRRAGQHHCMGQMNMSDAGKSVSIVAPKCPLFPVALVAPQPHSFMPYQGRAASVPLIVRPASLPQIEARYRMSYARSRQKRGPPVILHQL